jgi:hypothetical protein
MIFCVKTYFSNPTVTRVLVQMLVRQPGSPNYTPVRIKEAALGDPSEPPTEENPWEAPFELSGLRPARAVFHVVGLNANGNIVATRGITPRPRRP